MKNYSSPIKAAIAANKPIVYLYELNLVDGDYYLADFATNLTHNTDVYSATNLVLGSDPFKQQVDLTVLDFNILFTAVDQTMLALFLNDNQQNQTITVRKVIIDDDYSVIGQLMQTTVTIDSYAVNDGVESATMEVNCSNAFGAWQVVRGIRTTQASFSRLIPNTTSFINSKDINEELIWGGR